MKPRFRFSAIPGHARQPLVAAAGGNQTLYYETRLLDEGWPHYDFTTGFDRATPFLPWNISIYLASYAFWLFCYPYCASQEKQQAYRLFQNCRQFTPKQFPIMP